VRQQQARRYHQSQVAILVLAATVRAATVGEL